MALTRRMLKAMGIDDEKIDEIIAAHVESTDALKEERDGLKEKAEKVDDLQKKLQELQSVSNGDDEWKKKYDEQVQALEDFKATVEAEKAEAKKQNAYRAMLMSSDIDPKRIDSIMRVTDFSNIEMDGDELKDKDKLSESAKTEWADFVVKTSTLGTDPGNPPAGNKNESGADPDIEKRMAERHERLYGKSTTD